MICLGTRSSGGAGTAPRRGRFFSLSVSESWIDFLKGGFAASVEHVETAVQITPDLHLSGGGE